MTEEIKRENLDRIIRLSQSIEEVVGDIITCVKNEWYEELEVLNKRKKDLLVCLEKLETTTLSSINIDVVGLNVTHPNRDERWELVGGVSNAIGDGFNLQQRK